MIDSFNEAKTAIVQKLQGLTKIKYVYGYEKGDLSGFPAVTIYSSEYNPQPYDTASDQDVYIFTIHLYQEMDVENPADAETKVDNALVEIMQAFQTDYTLGGVVDCLYLSAQKGWVSREMINRAAVIKITCYKNNQII